MNGNNPWDRLPAAYRTALILAVLAFPAVLLCVSARPWDAGQGDSPAASSSFTDSSPYAGDDRLFLDAYEVYTYDEAGNLVNKECYKYSDGDIVLDSNCQYTYDDQGNLLCKDVLYSSMGYFAASSESAVYRYDEQGRRTYCAYTDRGDPHNLHESYYFYRDLPNGVTLKLDQSVYKGKLNSYTGWITDADGNEIGHCDYDQEGSPCYYKYNVYDAQGRVIYWKSSDGGLEEKPSQEAWLQWNDEYNTCTAFLYAPPEHLSALEYTAYDGENILWEMEYSSDGLISYRACRYDGEQLTRELSWEKELSRSNFFYYKYDRDGRLSEKYTYRVASDKIDLELSDGSTVQWTFTLAENGNTRCPSGITRTSRSGGLLEQFAFDTDGILTDQYTKEWNELWPQDPPVSPKYTSSDEEGD